MTGKEALNDLKKVVKNFLCNFEKEYTPLDYEKWFYKTKFDKIEEDLEVLEILKRYFNGYHNRIRLLNIFEGKDEYEILEEWLNK